MYICGRERAYEYRGIVKLFDDLFFTHLECCFGIRSSHSMHVIVQFNAYCSIARVPLLICICLALRLAPNVCRIHSKQMPFQHIASKLWIACCSQTHFQNTVICSTGLVVYINGGFSQTISYNQLVLVQDGMSPSYCRADYSSSSI